MNNENLRNKISHHQMSINHMYRQGFSAQYIAGAKMHHEAQIAALQRELNRRAAARREVAKGHWKKLGGGATALSIIKYLRNAAYRAPGGSAYKRIAGQTTYRRRNRSPSRRSPNKRSPGRSPRR